MTRSRRQIPSTLTLTSDPLVEIEVVGLTQQIDCYTRGSLSNREPCLTTRLRARPLVVSPLSAGAIARSSTDVRLPASATARSSGPPPPPRRSLGGPLRLRSRDSALAMGRRCSSAGKTVVALARIAVLLHHLWVTGGASDPSPAA